MATSTDCAADLLAPPNCDLESTPDMLFERVASDFAAPLARLVRAHEADPTLPADEIAEIAGLTSTNTHTKIHRIRQLLATQVNAGDRA